MIAWRIAHERFADLTGEGGLHVAGRWHTKGRPVCYLAEHPALAMLEVRVHMDLESALLSQYVLMKVGIPDQLAVMVIQELSPDESRTQTLGDQWLASSESAVCKVPSAILSESYNFLLNPLHPDASNIEILNTEPVEFDLRLFK